jgi:peroxiredoxin
VTFGIAPASRGVLLVLSLAAVAADASSKARADARNRLAATAPVTLPAPVTLDRSGGGRMTLPGSSDHVVLVHFFATWCEPCRPELASLERLRAEGERAGLTIVVVSVAEPEGRLRRFFAEHPVGFPVLMDPDRRASRAWSIEALPSTVVLDRRGRPRLSVRGDLDWQRADVRAALDDVVAETGPAAEDKKRASEP